jgi:hypothetical protein
VTPTITCERDTDGDGICDNLESGPSALEGQTNRYLPDSDGDGLWDGVEDADWDGNHNEPGETNPRRRDSDGDDYNDGIEVFFLDSDPLDANDPDAAYVDADEDELPASLDPNDGIKDTDSDRYSDGFEAAWFRSIAAASDPDQLPELGNVHEKPGDPPHRVDNADAQMILNFFGRHDLSPYLRAEYGDVRLDACVEGGDSQVTLIFFARFIDTLPFVY